MNCLPTHVLSGGARLLIAGAMLASVACPLAAQQLADEPWQPGKEYHVSDPAAGADGYFLAYVPADYDPSEKWPMVFYYHGLGGRPETNTISRIVEGKYCIVVGMSYYAPGMEGYRFLETEDIRIFHRVLEIIKQRLSVNDRRLYVAGFSKGGFYTCEMLRQLSGELAGAIVLSAGSKSLDASWPSLAGKEVFIGCGQEDHFLATAKATQQCMEAFDATVTFEQWPQVGHSVGDVAGLRKWLFEQTVDRPIAETMPSNVVSPPMAGMVATTQNAPKLRSALWGVGAFLAGFIVVGVVIVRRRRGKPAGLTSRCQTEGTEP